MFYISKDYGDDTYGVTDSNDNTEERYPLEEIKGYLSQGITIKGVSLKTDNIVVYPTLEAYCRIEVARLKLLGIEIKFSDDYKTVMYCKANSTVIKIPEFVTKINEYAFESCPFESITIPDSIEVIEDFAFHDCSLLKSIVIPNSVRRIGTWAFCKCRSLKSIVIPDSVILIAKDAFEDCDSVVISCKKGSYTEGYCQSLGIAHVLI